VIAVVASFKKLGVEFKYPDNWTLSEDDSGWPQVYSLESPSGSFWTLHLYPVDSDPEDIAAQFAAAMANEYDNLEALETETELFGRAACGHDMAFYYLDLMVEARTRAFRWGGQTALLFYQAESRDMVQEGPVFEAITTSLLREK